MQYNLSVNPKLSWHPALDGLRGIAVLSVMLRHFQHEGFNDDSFVLLPGGGIGVDLFFVLSGFLITTLLLQEWVVTRSISILNFYARRGLRLLPALFVFLISFSVIASLLRTPTVMTEEASGAVLVRNLIQISTYSFNWVQALGSDRVWGLGHLWSLSVEEQFYLAWPIILFTMLRFRLSARTILALSLLVFLASASLPFLMPDAQFGRIYTGTDYRIHSLMAGCILAQLYVSGALRQEVARNNLFRTGLVIAMALLVAVLLGARDKHYFLFSGGYTMVAVAASFLLVGALFATDGPGARLLHSRFLTYVGKRSYALYVWHYAIGFWLRDLETIPQLVTSFIISFIAAELSFRLVEQPALRLKTRSSHKSIPVGDSSVRHAAA